MFIPFNRARAASFRVGGGGGGGGLERQTSKMSQQGGVRGFAPPENQYKNGVDRPARLPPGVLVLFTVLL